MLEAWNYLYAYYKAYGPLLLIITLILRMLYWILANWGLIRATYSCVSLKNTVTGNIGKCFGSTEGSSCQSTDLGYVYGWCNDADNYGPLPGNKTGPYVGYCSQWSWCNKRCPPQQCPGTFPKGIAEQDPQIWGWCADEGVERAMIGTACGPRGNKCNNWIWEAKKCPTACQRPPPVPLRKKCGKDTGNTLGCPPKDKCNCSGPPSDPWKIYEGKNVYISTAPGTVINEITEEMPQRARQTLLEKAEHKVDNILYPKRCYLRGSQTRGAIAGLTDTEKAAKFSCDEADGKGDLYTLEKSVDGKYRVKDQEGCTLRWSSLKGGNKALGTEDMMAKFDCAGNNGEPLELEGTPDRAQFYGIIGGKKCGLQWSAMTGQNAGISDTERAAKFGCYDPGDSLVVDLA